MYTIIDVGESKICNHSSPSMWTSEYYRYCLRLLIAALHGSVKPLNVIFGDIECDFHNSNKTVKIDIQSEHTLVKLGGRSVDEIVWGNIDLLDGTGKYLIRIPNYGYYSSLDATIEYSLPNIVNIGSNDKFNDYLRRAVYIPPIIYDCPDFNVEERSSIITLGNNSDRRTEFARKAAECSLDISSVQNVLSKDHLKRVYNKTKIMVNVHQTDHHHTLEELRILPALCNGVIVVSEDVPLKDVIPYSDYIVWSSYDNLAETVRDVQNNYSNYHKKIFTHNLESKLMLSCEGNIEKFGRLIDRLT